MLWLIVSAIAAVVLVLAVAATVAWVAEVVVGWLPGDRNTSEGEG